MKTKKIYCVYLTTNTINGKIYVGFHNTSKLNDSYIGSGTLLKRAIKKYGKTIFTKEILATFDTKEEAEAFERLIVDDDFVAREDTYNLVVGGNVCILRGEKNGFFWKKTFTKNKRSNFFST